MITEKQKEKQAARIAKYEHLTGIKKTLAAEMVARGLKESELAREIGATPQKLNEYFKTRGEFGSIGLANKIIKYFGLKLVKIL